MLDAAEAERDLGWRPQGFHAGLDRLLTWALASRAASRAHAVRRGGIAAPSHATLTQPRLASAGGSDTLPRNRAKTLNSSGEEIHEPAPRVRACDSYCPCSHPACAPRPGEVASEHAEAGAAHPGEAVYQQWCASCHDNGGQSGAPSLAAIRTLNRATVKYALELGYMKIQAKDVPKEELAQLIDWLPSAEGTNDELDQRRALPDEDPRSPPRRRARASRTTFGVTNNGNRAQTAEETGLTRDQMKDLEVAWVVAFPQTPTMRSQPVIVGDTHLHRRHRRRPPLRARHQFRLREVALRLRHDAPLLAHLRRSHRPSPAAIIMGDAAGFVHAVDAKTGTQALGLRTPASTNTTASPARPSCTTERSSRPSPPSK